MVRPDAPDDDASAIVVIVVRTGGIAGLRRRWRAEPGPDDEQRWAELIESCPWDAPESEPMLGADRYTWMIRATTLRDDRRRELPESALTGPWRELVDAVRDQPRDPSDEAGGQ